MMKFRWHMAPMHWGEGFVERFCEESDPAWKGNSKTGGPYIRYETPNPLTFKEAMELAKKLNDENDSKLMTEGKLPTDGFYYDETDARWYRKEK